MFFFFLTSQSCRTCWHDPVHCGAPGCPNEMCVIKTGMLSWFNDTWFNDSGCWCSADKTSTSVVLIIQVCSVLLKSSGHFSASAGLFSACSATLLCSALTRKTPDSKHIKYIIWISYTLWCTEHFVFQVTSVCGNQRDPSPSDVWCTAVGIGVCVCVCVCVCVSFRAVRCCPLSLAKPLIPKHQVTHLSWYRSASQTNRLNEAAVGSLRLFESQSERHKSEMETTPGFFSFNYPCSGCHVFPSEWFDLFLNCFREHLQTSPLVHHL